MPKIDANHLVLNISQSRDVVKCFVESQEPVMIWGPPGIGKSDLIKEVGEQLDRPVIDIRLSLYGSEDIKGYPFIDEETGKMKFSISNEFPQDSESNAILFFDEINAAMPSTQLAMYQLILNRKIGEYELPAGVSVVAAGNRETDKAGLSEMPKPLQNRFAHIEVESDFKPWLEWAINNEVNADVVGFLSNFPEKLFEFDPSRSSRAFATPRSWTKASSMLNVHGTNGHDMIFNLVSSCVGTPNAHEFIQFRKLMERMPPLDSILDGEQMELKDDQGGLGLQYAIITSLLYRLNNIRKTMLKQSGNNRLEKGSDNEKEFYAKFNNFFKFLKVNIDTIGPEFIIMTMTACTSTYNIPIKMQLLPDFKELYHQNQQFLKEVVDLMSQDQNRN